MKYIFVVALTLSALSSFCQSVTKVLVVDTLVSSDSTFKALIKKPFKPVTTVEEWDELDSLAQAGNYFLLHGYMDKRVSAPRNFIRIPQVVLPIVVEDSSIVIDLPLDDSGGVLSVKGVYQLKADTIRIGKLSVFHNCFTDTIKRDMSWWLANADTTRDVKFLRRKVYRPQAVIKGCNSVIPEAYRLLINRKEYIVSPEKRTSFPAPYLAHGHKKMSKRKERRYEERKANNKPYEYFVWRERAFKYYLFAEVTLH